MNTRLEVGRVLRPQGIRGELKVQAFTDAPEELAGLETLWVVKGGDQHGEKDGEQCRMTVESARIQKDEVYLCLEGIDDRDAAEGLRGAVLWAERDALAPEEGRYFIADLIGLRVTDGEREYGRLTEVLQNGSADVYVLDGGRVLFPALKRCIREIAPAEGRILVDAQALQEIAVFEGEGEEL